MSNETDWTDKTSMAGRMRTRVSRLLAVRRVEVLALSAIALIVAVDPIAAQEFGGGGGDGGNMITFGTSFIEWVLPRGFLLLFAVAIVTHIIGDAKSVEDDKKFLQWRNKAILGIPITVVLIVVMNLMLTAFGYEAIDVIPNFSV